MCVPIPTVRLESECTMYNAIVITVSDRCYCGERVDLAGPVVEEILLKYNYTIEDSIIVPDEKVDIVRALNQSVDKNISLIVTTGGTGFSKRDITPDATKEVIEREAPGISEYMRYKSMEITPRGMLSRGVSGIKKNSLIINLPGSPKAAKENLIAVIETLEHGLKMLLSEISDCASE